MLIHSSLFRRYYPFNSYLDVQQAEEKDRETLAKHIRSFPSAIRQRNVDAALSYTKGKLGSPYLFKLRMPDGTTPKSYCKALASKVAKRQALSDDELKDVNMVLYAHKYNRFWSTFIPMPIQDYKIEQD